jgi:hypothetical protein
LCQSSDHPQRNAGVQRDEFKGWYQKVGSRFKPEVLEEALKATPEATLADLEKRAEERIISKKRVLELVQAAREGDSSWRSKAEDWLLEVKEKYRERFEPLEKEWIEWRQNRLRTTPRKCGTIDIICNSPRSKKWRVFGFKCTAPYHPGMLWSEVQSWMKDCGVELRLEDLSYDHIWDEEGLVDPDIQRAPIEGERVAFLMQPNAPGRSG